MRVVEALVSEGAQRTWAASSQMQRPPPGYVPKPFWLREAVDLEWESVRKDSPAGAGLANRRIPSKFIFVVGAGLANRRIPSKFILFLRKRDLPIDGSHRRLLYSRIWGRLSGQGLRGRRHDFLFFRLKSSSSFFLTGRLPASSPSFFFPSFASISPRVSLIALVPISFHESSF